MSLVSKVEKAGKIAGKAATWAVPALKQRSLDNLLDEAKRDINVKDTLTSSPSQDEYNMREERLRYHLERTIEETHNLYRFAKLVDTYDKALVPVDAVADYMKIMGGVGYGLSAAKEIVEAPAKIAYNAYYLGKTRDVRGLMYNVIYEGLSFLLPGSLLDLTNHYLKQADKYTVKKAVSRFLKEIEERKAKEKETRKPGLEEALRKAA